MREVAQRLLRGQAEALLAEREPQLLAERALDAARGELEAGGEADAGLDRRHEQVDELGHLAVDLLEPRAARGAARGRRADTSPSASSGRRPGAAAGLSAAGEREQEERAPARWQGGEDARADERGDRGPVHARRVEQLAQALLAARAGRRSGRVRARPSRSRARSSVLRRSADVVCGRRGERKP